MKAAIPQIHFGFKLTRDVYDRRHAQAEADDRSMGAVARRALEEYLAARERASIEKEEVTG